MSSVRELHDKAMELAHLAIIAHHNQELEKAENLSRQAYDYEAKAAELVPEGESSEPTRSILYRSAASLAYQCKEFNIAQRLIFKGLSGYPPPQIEKELKDLFVQINFESNLQSRGITLTDEDIQLSMGGEGVGLGIVLYDEFITRIKTTRILIDRVTQRVLGATFQHTGRIAKNLQPFTPTLAVAKPGSFAITIKLAIAKGEQIPLFINAAKIIDEFMVGIELINNADEGKLRERIKNDSYYENFLVLTRDIAPDGNKINFIGFSSNRKIINFTRQRNLIEIIPKVETHKIDESKTIQLEGIMDYATARKKEAIGLTTDNGETHLITVKESLEDLVKSYFKQYVMITGIRNKKNIYLTDIQLID